MTNCPALRRHIYANLGRKGREPAASSSNLRIYSHFPSPPLPPSGPSRSPHLTLAAVAGSSVRSAPATPRDVENSVNYVQLVHACVVFLSRSSPLAAIALQSDLSALSRRQLIGDLYDYFPNYSSRVAFSFFLITLHIDSVTILPSSFG